MHLPDFSLVHDSRPTGVRKLTRLWAWALTATLSLGLPLTVVAADTSAAAQLARWSAASGKPGNAAQGEVFFNSTHGDKWSCATCHGKPATATGTHASTGKAIKPMAPAVTPEVFTDTANIDKWFRRNCKDVISRECSSTEKADVIAYLLSLSR